MTTLESVALDQRRWSSTALSLKDSNWARFRLMAALILAGAILEAVALQMHTSYPAVSQLAGYAGAFCMRRGGRSLALGQQGRRGAGREGDHGHGAAGHQGERGYQ